MITCLARFILSEREARDELRQAERHAWSTPAWLRASAPRAGLFWLLLGSLPLSAAEHSTVRPAETVVLMPAAGHLDADGAQWVVQLHAWVYVRQESRFRRAAIARLLHLRYGHELTPASARYFDPRINLLLADNKRGRTVVVDVAGARATLSPTEANGHARGELRLPVTQAARDGARLSARVVFAPGDSRLQEASVALIGKTGLSVISDIDDTVKITHVREPRRMWETTFYKPFEPVAGMAEAYRGLAEQGAAIHYVSSSPWHLAEPLLEFLRAGGFPLATLALKHMRLKDRTLLDIARPGRETKPPQIAAILARFPLRRFVLIGDSGEDDPEIYAEVLRRHPAQIVSILIRNITNARREDARFTEAFAGLEPARWALFEDPAVIVQP